jgi:hypothetical protein
MWTWTTTTLAIYIYIYHSTGFKDQFVLTDIYLMQKYMENITLSATEWKVYHSCSKETHHNINKLACIECYFKFFMEINSFNPQFSAFITVIPIEGITEAVQSYTHTHTHCSIDLYWQAGYCPGTISGDDIGMECWRQMKPQQWILMEENLRHWSSIQVSGQGREWKHTKTSRTPRA